MTTRYSTCHFAEMMFGYIQAKHIGAEPVETQRCSFCGQSCSPVPQSHRLEHDLELTLRRWKDGDCTLDEMFSRVNTELERSWFEAFQTAAKTLQSTNKPKYKLNIQTLQWLDADCQAIDLVSTGSDTKNSSSNPQSKNAPKEERK